MARRHEKAIAVLQAAKAVAMLPRKGLLVQAFFVGECRACGDGWRPFIVLQCGPKWVTCFYISSLSTFRLDHKQWALLHPQLYSSSAEVQLSTIDIREKSALLLGTDYSQASVLAARSILMEHMKHDGIRSPSSARVSAAIGLPQRGKSEPAGTSSVRKRRGNGADRGASNGAHKAATTRQMRGAKRRGKRGTRVLPQQGNKRARA